MKCILHLLVCAILVVTIRSVSTDEVSNQSFYKTEELENGVAAFSRDIWVKDVYSATMLKYKLKFLIKLPYKDWLKISINNTTVNAALLSKTSYEDWLRKFLSNSPSENVKNTFSATEWIKDVVNETFEKYGKFFKKSMFPIQEWITEVLNKTESTYKNDFTPILGYTYKRWLNQVLKVTPISPGQTYAEFLLSLYEHTSIVYKLHMKKFNFNEWLEDVLMKTSLTYSKYFKMTPNELELNQFTKNVYSHMLLLLLPKYEKYFEATNYSLEYGLRECMNGAEPNFENQTYAEWLKSITKGCPSEYKDFMKAVDFPIDEIFNLVYTNTRSMYERFFKPGLSTFYEEFVQDALESIGFTCGSYFEKGAGFSLEAGLRDALTRSTADFNGQTYKDFINMVLGNASPAYIQYMEKVKYPTEECVNLLYDKTISKYAPFFKVEVERFKQKWLSLILDITPDRFVNIFKEGSGLSYEAALRNALKNVKVMFSKQSYRQWLISLSQSVPTEYKKIDFPVEEWINFIFNETFTYFPTFKSELSIFSNIWITDVLKLTTDKCGIQFSNGSGFSYAGGLFSTIRYSEPKFNEQTYKEWILAFVEKYPLAYKQYMENINYPLHECLQYIYETTKDKYQTYFKQKSDNFVEEWLTTILLISSDKFEKYYEPSGILSYRDGLMQAVKKTVPLFTEQTYKEFLESVTENLPPEYIKYLKSINFELNTWISYIYNETITIFGSYFKDDMSIFTKTFMIDNLIITDSKVKTFFPKGSGYSYEAMLRYAFKYSEPMFHTETFRDWLKRAVEATSPEDMDFMKSQNFTVEKIVNLIYTETKSKYAPFFKQNSPTFIEMWIEDVYFLTENKFVPLFKNSNLTYIGALKAALLTPPIFSEQTYKEWLTSLVINLPSEYKELCQRLNFNPVIWINFVYHETIHKYNTYFKEELTIFSQSWVRDVMLVSTEICGRYFDTIGSGFSFSGGLRSSVMKVEPTYRTQSYRIWINTLVESHPLEYKDYMETIRFPLNECIEFVYDETKTKYEPLFKQIPNYEFLINWQKYILRISSSKYSPIYPPEIQKLGLSYEGAVKDAISKVSSISFEKQTYIEWLYNLANNLSPLYKLYLTNINFDMDEFISFIYNESVLKFGTYFKSSLNIFAQSFIRDALILRADTCGTYFDKGTGISFVGTIIESLKLSPPIYDTQTYRSWIQNASTHINPKVQSYLDSIKFPLERCVNYIYYETLPKYGPLFKQESRYFDKLWLNYVLKISSHIYSPLFSKELSYHDGLKSALEASKPISFDQTYKEWLKHVAESRTPEYYKYLNEIKFDVNDWINFIYSNTVSKFGSFFKDDISTFNQNFVRDVLLVSGSTCGNYFKKNKTFSLESATRIILDNYQPNFKNQTFKEWFSNAVTKISPELSSYLKSINYPLKECSEFIFNETYDTYEPYFVSELSEFAKHWLTDVLLISQLKYSKYFKDGTGLSYEAGLTMALSKAIPNYSEQSYREWLQSIVKNATPEYIKHMTAVNFPLEEWLRFVYYETAEKYGIYFQKNVCTFGRL